MEPVRATRRPGRLVGKTMHAVDERAPVAEIRDLQAVYERLIARYFARFGSAS